MSKNSYRVYKGPFYNLDSIKSEYSDIIKLNFENIEIIKLWENYLKNYCFYLFYLVLPMYKPNSILKPNCYIAGFLSGKILKDADRIIFPASMTNNGNNNSFRLIKKRWDIFRW